jgi:hypothetical protein
MISILRLETLDLVAELRLRQWARRNFVSGSERTDSDWHPVVLDEMRRKESEMAGEASLRIVIGSAGIVPLERSRHMGVRIDQAHAELAAPRLSRRLGCDSSSLPRSG